MGLTDAALPDPLKFASKSKKVEITCNGDKIPLFSDLVIKQELNAVSTFSFIWRKDIKEGNLPGVSSGKTSFLSKHSDFQNKHIGKEVKIKALSQDGLIYNGIISSIECFNPYKRNVEYKVEGKGYICKMADIEMCNSWQNKNLKNIISDLVSLTGISDSDFECNTTHTDPLAYVAQYNQSVFNFIASLAIKHGQWFYYTGEKMVFGKPDSKSPTKISALTSHLFDIKLKTNYLAYQEYAKGFDEKETKSIDATQFSPAKPDKLSQPLFHSSFEGGKSFVKGNKSKQTSYIPAASTKESIKTILEKSFKVKQSSSVYITGESNVPSLGIGKTVKLEDSDDAEIDSFVITEITHESSHFGHYINKFKAVPKSNAFPPPINPPAKIYTPVQMAIVKANDDSKEDDSVKGKSKVKVHFPWQADNETTPWINLMGLHGGLDKGVHFLPEIEDIVMVDFVDGNVEIPYVIGTVYTGKQKSNIETKDNNLKSIATREGLRLQFDDDKKAITIADNFLDKFPRNYLETDNSKFLKIESSENDENAATIVLNKKEGLVITVLKGGNEITSIVFDANSKKITIEAQGDIDITADKKINLKGQEITLKGQKISINADTALEMKSGNEVKIGGTKIAANANAQLELKGAMGKLEASGMLEVKSSGILQVQGSLVKIN